MKPYYEGWYMKQQQGEDVLAVIPGRAQDSAFIQVVSNRGSRFLPYPLEAFDRTDGSMRIGDSLFTPYGMQLRIDEPDFELVGSVRYDHLLPLRSDIMGPFAYVPMETKHTVFSMRHQVTGSIRLNGDALDIRNGIGYMEGDRGHTFPRSYFWMQCLDVRQDASVMLAIAEIPLGPIRFTGCIGIVALGETEYRFATYRGVRIVEASSRRLVLRQGRYLLEASFAAREAHPLRAPRTDGMTRTIRECNRARARFRFWEGGGLVFDLCSENASLECEEAVPDGAKRRGALL